MGLGGTMVNKRLRGEAIKRRVEELWAEGKTTREIADVMGWTVGTARVRVSRLRTAGADLPVRNAAVQAWARVNAGDMSAARAARYGSEVSA